ncbi:hypothetical protein FHR83_009280 [Actinoplanes campanulatus]|uniref:Uncharacterized protein n=1 Tax=Actinoplanes campanulatus TaxID=113559 RepID=A0A7W5ASE0_9ACTN|nr:hypothetical protein [Actinoplanes campanulatus]MBB3101551.1 hypothetical protein [Actinoplanes campanulatus]GGN51447.1 hypothetical protein GCM10010109_91560 [Actinoplanes campanulatus]GID42614.1 hypothetical protein Aca09nite_91200 [Actinoplanes campanulatus]
MGTVGAIPTLSALTSAGQPAYSAELLAALLAAATLLFMIFMVVMVLKAVYRIMVKAFLISAGVAVNLTFAVAAAVLAIGYLNR